MQFDDISYLVNGNDLQKAAYSVLQQHRILEKLHPFDPVLVGTIPINIDIETSDLDIICHFENKELYRNTIINLFQTQKHFSIKEIDGEEETIVAGFFADGFMIEIFGQPIRSRQQLGYRHMLIEYALLNKYGETFRKQIIDLKRQGYKTEPAFAKLLGLDGDPYMALLQLEGDTNGQSKK